MVRTRERYLFHFLGPEFCSLLNVETYTVCKEWDRERNENASTICSLQKLCPIARIVVQRERERREKGVKGVG